MMKMAGANFYSFALHEIEGQSNAQSDDVLHTAVPDSGDREFLPGRSVARDECLFLTYYSLL